MKTLVVLDIDNTLAENAQREHLLPDWHAFHHACDTDTPIIEIIEAVKHLFDNPDVDVIFVTGRTGFEAVQAKTQTWLDNHLPVRPVFYRPEGNFSTSYVYKSKVVEQFKTDEHTHIVVIDDDKRICDHFQEKGATVVHIQKDQYANNAKQIAECLKPAVSNPLKM